MQMILRHLKYGNADADEIQLHVTMMIVTMVVAVNDDDDDDDDDLMFIHNNQI